MYGRNTDSTSLHEFCIYSDVDLRVTRNGRSISLVKSDPSIFEFESEAGMVYLVTT